MKSKYINPAIIVKEVCLTNAIAQMSYGGSADDSEGLARELMDFDEEDNSPKNGSFDVWED